MLEINTCLGTNQDACHEQEKRPPKSPNRLVFLCQKDNLAIVKRLVTRSVSGTSLVSVTYSIMPLSYRTHQTSYGLCDVLPLLGGYLM